MRNKDFKTISFYKFAQSIGAVEQDNRKDPNIDVNNLLSMASNFLNKNNVLTRKQKQEYNIFKDKYNRYLQYCNENNLTIKGCFYEIEELNNITVPDMSKIKIPDIRDELKEMDIDLNKLTDMLNIK